MNEEVPADLQKALEERRQKLLTMDPRDELRRRAENLDGIYGYNVHGRAQSYRMQLEVVSKQLADEIRLINVALNQLERGNSKLAETVVMRPFPDFSIDVG